MGQGLENRSLIHKRSIRTSYILRADNLVVHFSSNCFSPSNNRNTTCFTRFYCTFPLDTTLMYISHSIVLFFFRYLFFMLGKMGRWASTVSAFSPLIHNKFSITKLEINFDIPKLSLHLRITNDTLLIVNCILRSVWTEINSFHLARRRCTINRAKVYFVDNLSMSSFLVQFAVNDL